MRVSWNWLGRSGTTSALTRPRRRVRILPGNIPNLFRLLFLATVLSVPLILFLHSRGPPTSEFVKFLHPLYPNSDSALLDLEDFRFSLATDVCRKRNETLFTLLLIHSAPNHFDNRKIIRQIWGHLPLDFGEGYVVRSLFLLGRVGDQRLQSKIVTESRLHGDILQGNFVDSYRNLTYKHVMGLKWAGLNCRHAHFLVKMDDDIYIDVFRLAKALDHKYPLLYNDPVDRSRGRIACYVHKNMPVVRDQSVKWYVSSSEYQADYYPEFCSGWSYGLTPSVASRLAHSALYFPYFWVDDVHVTGIVASHAGITRDAMNDCCFCIDASELRNWVQSPGEYSWRHMVAPVWDDLQLFQDAHRKTTWCRKVHCQCCFKEDQMAPINVPKLNSEGEPFRVTGAAVKLM